MDITTVAGASAVMDELSESESLAQAEMLTRSIYEDGHSDVTDAIDAVDTVSPAESAEPAESTEPAPASESDILAALLPPAILIPPAPGSEHSMFRRCACLGVMPGRACLYCSNSRWLRTCAACTGAGKLTKPTRRGGEPRSERCGFCMGRGTVPAKQADIVAAQIAHDEATAAADQGAQVRLFEDQPGFVRTRPAKLPKAEGSTIATPRSKPGKAKAKARARSDAAAARARARASSRG
jgi:hypothetical protein